MLKENIRRGTQFVFSKIKVYRRGSLVPIRYVAQATRSVSVTYLVG